VGDIDSDYGGAAVNKKADSNAFRAQLVVPEQRQLYDYWQGKAAGRAMPARGDIQPTHIPRILPCISLLDVAANVGRRVISATIG
jgi:hypothetical protein